jgi:hypothetical protein
MSSAKIFLSSSESVLVWFWNASITFFSSCLRSSGDNVLFKRFFLHFYERLLGVGI